jgi:hypothetical protein
LYLPSWQGDPLPLSYLFFDQSHTLHHVDLPIAYGGEFALPFPLERAGWSGIKI